MSVSTVMRCSLMSDIKIHFLSIEYAPHLWLMPVSQASSCFGRPVSPEMIGDIYTRNAYTSDKVV